MFDARASVMFLSPPLSGLVCCMTLNRVIRVVSLQREVSVPRRGCLKKNGGFNFYDKTK